MKIKVIKFDGKHCSCDCFHIDWGLKCLKHKADLKINTEIYRIERCQQCLKEFGDEK